jgi:uncharacterized membrane protein YgcG
MSVHAKNLPRVGVLPLLAVLVLGGLVAGPAAARTLHWRELRVDAHLEADGSLHLTETHTMVFTGAWNGGERKFHLAGGQRIELLGVYRIDPQTGERRALRKGDLGQVDHYDWADHHTLRWRSRRPSDPEFDDTELTYVLDYRMTGVLRPEGDGVYRLRHDFAFPERSGTIEHYHLDLSVDPAFEPLDTLPASLDRDDLVPGLGVVLTARLRYRGAAAPAAALPPPVILPVRLALAVALLAAMVWLFLRFARREGALGRLWGPAPPAEWIDRAWIEEHLLSLRPEEAGAYWDRTVGPPEVAALLARLVGEGKMASEVEAPKGLFGKEDLRLRLLADRDAFSGYERTLVDKLFFDDRTEVTTSDLKAHYKRSGFDPAGAIRPDLERRLKLDTHEGTARPTPSRRPTALLTLGAVALLVAQLLVRRDVGLGVLIALAFAIPVFYVGALVLAFVARQAVDGLRARVVSFAVPMGLMTAGVLLAAFRPEIAPWLPLAVPPGLLGLGALLLAPLAAWSSVLNAAASRERPETIAARRELVQIRRHLAGELGRPEPDLDDSWFPYLLAFGLSSAMDRWAKAFGGAAAAGSVAAMAALSHGGASGDGGSGGWTGGGGSFGGAGASGAWASAVSGMASGVSAPSSSGGGGGGVSGGGGGGGW